MAWSADGDGSICLLDLSSHIAVHRDSLRLIYIPRRGRRRCWTPSVEVVPRCRTTCNRWAVVWRRTTAAGRRTVSGVWWGRRDVVGPRPASPPTADCSRTTLTQLVGAVLWRQHGGTSLSALPEGPGEPGWQTFLMHSKAYRPLFLCILTTLACWLVSLIIAESWRSSHVPAVSIVASPSPALNTLPLICVLVRLVWYDLSIFAIGLPHLLFTSSLPYSILVHRFLALATWPKYWSLRLCTVASSSRSCGCISCRTDVLVWCVVQLTVNNRRHAVISNTSYSSFVHSL